MTYCVVITTCADRAGAEALATAIVEAGLAACVHLDDISSVYRWDGRTTVDGECRLIIKTRGDRYDRLESFIAERHGYEVPQIIRLPIDAGLPAYLAWIDEALQAPAEDT